MRKIYETKDGDTFDKISRQLWGQERFFHFLMYANPDYQTTVFFSAGIKLKVPDIPVSAQETTICPPWQRS